MYSRNNNCARGPSIIQIGDNYGSANRGIQFCCFRCCTCFNFQFLSTECGKYKMAEVVSILRYCFRTAPDQLILFLKITYPCSVHIFSTFRNYLEIQLIGLICQTLAINYGMVYYNEVGSSYHSFLLTVSSCFMTSSLLLFCYLFSDKSFNLIRQSLFVRNNI